MSLNQSITAVLNGSIHTVNRILPFEMITEKPSLLHESYVNSERGVLIGMTGDLSGKLLIEGSEASFSLAGERMYGLPLEGDMLTSFTGELGNMIAGNLATFVSEQEVNIDITPPTIIEEEEHTTKHTHAFHVSLHMEENLHFSLILMVDDQKMTV